MRTIIALLFFVSCSPDNLYIGLTGTRSQGGYPVNTMQACIYPEQAVKMADIVITTVVGRLSLFGINPKLPDAIRICVVEQPEPCGIDGHYIGPCDSQSGLCERKAGCATSGWISVSVLGPPICETGFPDNHICVDGSMQTTDAFCQVFVHELFNLVVQNKPIYANGYRDKIFKVEKEITSGIVDIIKPLCREIENAVTK